MKTVLLTVKKKKKKTLSHLHVCTILNLIKIKICPFFIFPVILKVRLLLRRKKRSIYSG